jgi:hypothetical protein
LFVWFVVAALGVVAFLVLYATWTARRLDRLHARMDAAAAALVAQLVRRGATAEGFHATVALPAACAASLESAARDAVAASGVGHDREVVENALSRSLMRAVAEVPELAMDTSRALTDLHDEALRATFARRFYNDTVRDALVVRDRRVVRWLRLAGRAPHPAYFEMDDEELVVSRISVASGPNIDL